VRYYLFLLLAFAKKLNRDGMVVTVTGRRVWGTHGVLGGADGPVRLDAHVALDHGRLRVGMGTAIRVSSAHPG
jgi:hypothetical protein